MACNHTVDADTKIAIIGVQGMTSFEEIVRAVERLAADRRFRPDYGVLFDLREMHYSPLPSVAAERRLFRTAAGWVAEPSRLSSLDAAAR